MYIFMFFISIFISWRKQGQVILNGGVGEYVSYAMAFLILSRPEH